MFFLIACTLGGAILLSFFSIFQKVLLGADPFTVKGYLVPVVFGGVSGLGFGIAQQMQRREFKRRLLERDQAAQNLTESEERFRLLAENARDIIFRWSIPETRYEYISLAVFNLTGYTVDEFMVAPHLFQEIVHPDDKPTILKLRQEVQSGDLPPSVEFRLIHKDGRTVWVNQRHVVTTDGSGNPMYLEGITTDVTESHLARVKAEELTQQLRQAQKVEAIGRLAGGIAHDFNNLLTVINGYADLILEGVEPGTELHEQVSTILLTGNRAADLTHQLLTFSRKQNTKPVVLDPLQALHKSLPLLDRLIGEVIKIELEAEESLPLIFMDSRHLEQALLNLAANARDAMPDGGTLNLNLSRRELDSVSCCQCGRTISGHFLEISISDSGSGIPQEDLDSIFDPFFTTKEQGKGTGLGLSSVFGIIHQNDGHIRVESVPGKGSTFHILLPETTRSEAQESTLEEPALKILQGSETILLVEDELLIRNLTFKFLEQYGYCVLSAKNGPEAIELFHGHEGTIDLLLTDVIMPGMTGRTLGDTLVSLDPRLKVVFMSGFTHHIINFDDLEASSFRFLQKPFGAEALGRLIREMFDADPRP